MTYPRINLKKLSVNLAEIMWFADNVGKDWIEEDLTSHQTHYMSYRGRVFTGQWPNQQCQSTEGSEELQENASNENCSITTGKIPRYRSTCRSCHVILG